MNAVEITLSSDGKILKVVGGLNFETVPGLQDAADTFITSADQPIFDLAGVTKAESVALALMTTWHRKANALGKQARFQDVPKELMDIAKLSNLDKIMEFTNRS